MSRFFNKLKNHPKVAPGVERKVLRHIPQVFVFGLLGLGLPSLLARLFPIAGSVSEVQRWIGTVDIYVISLIVFYCTAIFTIGFGALIVMIMKGPAYVADAYPLIDFDKPYSSKKKED
ncbi:MAG: hypothetical protein B7Y55_03535 [Polynucleobacter sp. 35-46-207]|nr:MAG: hypothetical protein B7Y55_03535 [Polynucleobacter sp. 35-46-207]OZB47816.1 MAG: hypothetical protein B7X60_05375 [Polynucleobacter sp. 39-45-136]